MYILEINPLSFALFANIFSHSVYSLFVLFMVSFAVQKLLSLIRSHLLIFVFSFISVGGGSKKIKKDLAVIYVRECSECSNFILLDVAVQFSQHHLLKKLSCLPCIFLPPLS